MTRFIATAIAVALLAAGAQAALVLQNGSFDQDPDLGGADDTEMAPTGWYQHYTIPQSWSDFRFGNNGNGGWDNNGIALGQNYLGPNFEPGPEDGYYYTRLGTYGGELSVRVNGRGYNRINGNAAGSFVVSLHSTRPGAFTPADGTDIPAGSTLMAERTVDISSLTGSTPRSQPFDLSVTFNSKLAAPGDEIWLRIGDGPDDGNLDAFDEPIIDNLTLTVVVPEPSALALLLALAPLMVRPMGARRRTIPLRR